MKVLKLESTADDSFKNAVKQKLGRQVKIIDKNLSN